MLRYCGTFFARVNMHLNHVLVERVAHRSEGDLGTLEGAIVHVEKERVEAIRRRNPLQVIENSL